MFFSDKENRNEQHKMLRGFDELKNGDNLTREDYKTILKLGGSLSLVPKEYWNGDVLEASFVNPENLKFFDVKSLTTKQRRLLLEYQPNAIKDFPVGYYAGVVRCVMGMSGISTYG